MSSNVAVRTSIKKAPRKSKSPSLMGSVDLRVGAKISGLYRCRSSFSVRPNFGTTQNVPSQFSTKRMVHTHPKTAHPKLLWHAEPCGKKRLPGSSKLPLCHRHRDERIVVLACVHLYTDLCRQQARHERRRCNEMPPSQFHRTKSMHLRLRLSCRRVLFRSLALRGCGSVRRGGC